MPPKLCIILSFVAVLPATAMEESELYGGNSSVIVDETKQDDVMNSVLFVELKHLCVQLLDLLQNSKINHSFLSQLLHLLQRSSPPSLQPFLEYASISFPLPFI